ncbi:hypothetical protein ACFLTL_00845 [Chloroflexota bacterium]
MLEIRKIAIALNENELLELERIITDGDGKEALSFLRKSIYYRIAHTQKGRLKSHLDNASPVAGFIQHNK